MLVPVLEAEETEYNIELSIQGKSVAVVAEKEEEKAAQAP
jgi:hypothetical protein